VLVTSDIELARGIVAAFALTCFFIWLGLRCAARMENPDRRFGRACVLTAFLLFTGLVIWSQALILQGRFSPGDGEGYHLAGIVALDYFAEREFFITGEMLRLNYAGYPAYFIGPLYALGGRVPILVILAQLILHLHIAVMIYQMTRCVETEYRAARYAFLFALFFPDSIALSLYHLKDVLILWLTTLSLLNSVLITRFGISGRRLLGVALASTFLATLRTSNVLLVLLAFAIALANQETISRYTAAVAKAAVLGLVVWLLSDLISSSYKEVEGLMRSDYYREGVFPEAESPEELISVIGDSPLRGILQGAKVIQAMLTGGYAAVREIREMEFQLSLLNVASPIVSLGALWRYLNLPFTAYGLWVLVSRRRRTASPVLAFSLLVMATMFVLGYGGRWGLPGMVLNSMAWGIGYSRTLGSRSVARAHISANRAHQGSTLHIERTLSLERVPQRVEPTT